MIIANTLSNNDFNSYSTSTTPYSPSNWTYENPTNNESIKAGVINVHESVYPDKADEYGLKDVTNPGTPTGSATGSDDPLYKHLMINSPSGRSRAGYTSTNFTLNANSYYGIDVIVKTVGEAQASIYINNLSDNKVDASITGINNSNWDTHYTIFIETNDFVSETVSLGLWLGGQSEDKVAQGAALFNKVTITEYSKTTFNSTIAHVSNLTSKVVSLKDNHYITNAILNPDFNITTGDQNAITNWTTIESAQNQDKQEYKIIDTQSYNPEVDTQKGIANPLTNNMTTDSKVLYINNIESAKFGIESSKFTLPQSELYRLSVWTKTDCNTGNGATLKIVEVNPDESDEDFVATEASVTCATSVASNPATNGWTMNTFFLEGHPLKDTEVKLQILLGDGTETTGYVFVDNITLEKVSNAVYKNAESLYSYNANNTGYVITNGNFNATKKHETTLTYPLTASNWELISNDNVNTDQITSGVINTNSAKFELAKQHYSAYDLTIANPGLTPSQIVSGATVDNSSNNVLVIGNAVETTQTYKSDSFKLSANSYYKLSYQVNTQFAAPVTSNQNFGVNVTIKNSDYTLFSEKNISTDSNWQTKTIYFKTGTNEHTTTIELTLNNIQGFAFFDNIQLESSTEATFTALTAADTKVDLSQEQFNLYDQNSTSALNTLYNWTGTNNVTGTNVTFGALDTTKNIDSVIGTANPGSINGKNVLLIYAADDTHFTATNKNAYNLTVGEYYKVTVSIKTVGLSQENHSYDENNNIIDYGVSIGLTGFDSKFTGINTQNETNPDNDYVTYTFYLAPDGSTTTALELSMGSENSLVSGYAFFDNVVFESIDETTYSAIVKADDSEKENVLILNRINPDSEPEDTGSEFSGSEFDWVIIPSLLTGLAIVIALVGSLLRQFKFTKKPKIKTSYDRRKTVEVEMDKRERIALRNQIIAELNKEYAEIDDEIAELNKQLEIDKANSLKVQEEKRAEHNKIKQAILVEKENAIKEYNEKMANIADATDKDKQKFEKQFNAFIEKLDKRAQKEESLANAENKHIEKLQAKHNAKVKQLTERQLFIKQEIERIEREIESIAKQEEIMWNEYRRAKEEAKKEKLEYLAEKRKQKQSKKQPDQVDSTEDEKTVEETNENTDLVTETEIIEPDVENTEDNKTE